MKGEPEKAKRSWKWKDMMGKRFENLRLSSGSGGHRHNSKACSMLTFDNLIDKRFSKNI